MISEVEAEVLESTGNKGPQIDKTAKAQAAVDEFLASGLGACSVGWREIDPDFDTAKKAIAYRISHSKRKQLDGTKDLSMRSNRPKGEIYLVHTAKQ